jgi:pimeloyl-ACP methyl ester carboxylesterase
VGESISAEPSASQPLVPTAESSDRPADNVEPSPGGALQGEVAVLLHGLGPGAFIMRRLARRVSQAGYETINWSYPSLRQTIEAHAQKLHELLGSLDARTDVKRIHLVTYSMGSIITRYALGMGRPAKLGRIVMIAPPNRGSFWAALVGPALRPCIRIIDQLAARPGSFVNELPQPDDLEIGVIAARQDLLVGCANTHLPKQTDHLVLPGLHSTIVLQRNAAQAVLQFLAAGRFTAA